jgi:photosystem II stability/assembly factor-like uncharacterized protein
MDTYVQNEREVVDFGHRKRELEFRRDWFHLFRTTDARALSQLWLDGFAHKQRLIEQFRGQIPHLAAYDSSPSAAGTPWFSIGPRNVNGRVKALAVHPGDPNTVYAGAASGGIWKSVDACESWRPLWDTTLTMAAAAIAIAPSDPKVVYVGTGEWAPGYGANYPGAGMYVSLDAGVTWTLRAGVVARRIAQVLVSPTNAKVVYVAGDSGFERSLDGGLTWSTLHTGEISDAVIDPNNANILYIAVRFDRIYKTTNGGTTWTGLAAGPTGLAAEWLRLAIGKSGASGSNHICAKQDGTIYRSTNGGTSWTTLSGSHGGAPYTEWTNMVAVAPDNDNIIFAGGVGAERTINAGATWTGFSGSLLHGDYHRAVFAPSNPNIVYHCSDGGVFRSTTKGSAWEKTSDGLVVTQFYDVNAWQKYSTVLGGGTQDNGTNVTTGGLTWRGILGNDGGYLVIHPTDPHIMYAETQDTDLHKTVNGGLTWASINAGLIGSTRFVGVLTMDPAAPNTLYVGTTFVHKTIDGAATPWKVVSQNFGDRISSIAVAPSDSNRVYAAAGTQVFRTDDGGTTTTWANKTVAPLPGRPITDLVVDPANRDRVFLAVGGPSGASSPQAVYRSTNGGNSWTDISSNLPNVGVNALELDPANPLIVYAGTDVGAFRTINGGTSWHAFDNGLPYVPITDLYVDPEDRALIAATMGRGMYKVSTSTTAEPVVDLYLRDDDLDTGERIPSPAAEPDPLDTTSDEYWWMSPDIKVQSSLYTPDAVFDGVEFDTEVTHQDTVRGASNRFYLQVHNRGWRNATNVRVRAFFTDASAGLPALPGDFWTAFPGSDPSGTVWRPIGPARTIAVLEPNRPVIVSWDWSVPAGAATHSCLLAVSTCTEDPITTTQLDPALLVPNEKRVCLKNLNVVSAGPSSGQKIMAIDFHNASAADALIDIAIDATRFDGANLGLLLGTHSFANPETALRNASIYPLRQGEYLGDWGARGGDGARHLQELLARLDTTHLYELDPARLAELRGIPLASGEVLHGALTAYPSRRASYTGLNRLAVFQRRDGLLVGGSTFEFRLTRARGLAAVSRIRIVLEKVRITDRHRHLFACEEYRFKVAVGFNDSPCRLHEMTFPHKGYVKPEDKELTLDACVFEGYVAEADRLRLAILPSDHSLLHDHPLVLYSRAFDGPPETWVGQYRPDDQTPDPEHLKDWELWYRIESLPLP